MSEMKFTKWSECAINYLHEHAGICSHCGKAECHGKALGSKLPHMIDTEIVLQALTKAGETK